MFVMFHAFKEGAVDVRAITMAAHSIRLAYPLSGIVLLSNVAGEGLGLPDFLKVQAVPVDFSTLMFSRILAYQAFVEQCRSEGYVIFCDTDMLVLRRFDELLKGQSDLTLTLRKNIYAPILGSLYIVNMSRKVRIQRFFAAFVDKYRTLPAVEFKWDGDQTAIAQLLLPPALKVRKTVQAKWEDMDINYISVETYNNTPTASYLRRLIFQPRAKVLHFKGPRKDRMDKYYRLYVQSIFGRLLRAF